MSLEAWMYRFFFPGFAEREWVLPRDVEHPEPWYQPLHWSAACQDLREWSHDPLLADKLRELHEATFGSALHEPAGIPLHMLMAPLIEAFERGDLVAWVIRVHAVERPALRPQQTSAPIPDGQGEALQRCPDCPDMEIEVNGTDSHSDDLVLVKCQRPAHRSLTCCRIRIKVPCTGAATAVELVNPDGRLRFPEEATKKLMVPADGSWVWFDMSGEIASQSLDDAVIEAHCKDKSGKITARATVTVVSFDSVIVTATPQGSYALNSGVFGPVSPNTVPAVTFSASATLSPSGVDASAPQLKQLRIGLLQNVHPGDHFTATYGNPKMVAWADDARSADVPTTVSNVEFSVGVHNDCLTQADAPLYDQSSRALVVPGGIATSTDSPDMKASPTIQRPAEDALGQPAGTVEYSLLSAKIDVSFVLWAVVVDVGAKPDKTQIGELCALRERTWTLRVDSSATGAHKATESPSDAAPTMDPVTTGILAKQALSQRTDLGTAMTTLKK